MNPCDFSGLALQSAARQAREMLEIPGHYDHTFGLFV